MDLFFSLNGRIGRGKWWLGVFVFLIVAIVIGYFFPAMATSPMGIIAMQAIFIYPVICLYIKRLHDRDKSGNPWLWLFLGPNILYNLLSAFGVGFTQIEIAPGQTVPSPEGLMWLLLIAMVVFGIWAIVECGFLVGTRGDNRFGPNPVSND